MYVKFRNLTETFGKYPRNRSNLIVRNQVNS